ncbi:MAG TPA: ABC transporter permease subunit/CPBP intramembrane protease, partial [Isosphaeraceae bacterium]|nr:ABC transporter permease subunit/CPBP intramembrane protease [Isosphaeraceae bacterium]
GLLDQKQNKVVVVGAEFLPKTPRLLNERGDGFDPSLFDVPSDAWRLVVSTAPSGSDWSHSELRRAAIRGGMADAVVIIPPDVQKQLEESQSYPVVSYDSANERSQTTYLRVRELLANWKDHIVASRLKRDNKPLAYTEPIMPKPEDLAPREEAGSSVWAKLFPFLLVMMSLTGAFYPAVDLCAGEKERGTMETLLISPASRAEIVMGKFFTVVLASMATALLNLLSMGLTGAQVAHMVSNMAAAGGKNSAIALAPPTLQSAFWMIVLLFPLSAFFSAVCLALGVMAKSMKEGQYYMTPLYLVALPLVFLSLVPGIELNLFYSLVPITGVSLLLKSLMQGEYDVARHYFLAVLMPTIVYGAVALRWAVDQFQREGVLFREAERLDLKIWIRHVLRDKEQTPTGGEALFCFVLMLTSAWFLIRYMSTSPGAMAAGQVAFILTPPLAMGFLLTSNPRRTLRLFWPKGKYLALAVGLVLALNPLVSELRMVVEYLFPIPQTVREALSQMMIKMPNPWTALVLLALVPAICEETAFRGYILSGLERTYSTRSAIIFSALLFGFLHVLLSLFQQLFNAALLGLVLGLLAVRSRSLLPGIVFHFLNNALVLLHAFPTKDLVGPGLAGWVEQHHLSSWLYRNPEQGLYHWPWLVAGALAAAILLWRLALERDDAKVPFRAVDALAEPVTSS